MNSPIEPFPDEQRDEEAHARQCTEDSYRIARSNCIHLGMDGFEGAVAVGVQYGAASLTPAEQKVVAVEVSRRLFGRDLGELAEEERREIELEEAEFNRRLNDR